MRYRHTFRIFGIVTLAAVYFLILVGSIVRASGAGMGCPDWPKCFGQWIPPTNVSQLPPDYQKIYAARGYADTQFNVVKTWTEYINRLVGMTVGLLVFGTLLLSFSYWKKDKLTVGLCAAAFFLTGFAGWLGKYVVDNNLLPITVTLHMATALLIVTTLIWALTRAQRDRFASLDESALSRIRLFLMICLALSLIQIFMGTQVRQTVDTIAATYGEEARSIWAKQLGTIFYIHRSFSILVLLANGVLAYQVWRLARTSTGMVRAVTADVAIIVLEIITGASLYYLGFPAFLQPVHLLLATLMFGVQLFLLMALRYSQAKRDAESQSMGIQAAAHP